MLNGFEIVVICALILLVFCSILDGKKWDRSEKKLDAIIKHNKTGMWLQEEFYESPKGALHDFLYKKKTKSRH